MLPSTSDIFLAPLCLDEYYQKKVGFWNDVYGVTMKTLQTKAHKEFFSNPVFDRLIKPEDLLCDAVNVFHIDMHKDDAEVLHVIHFLKFSVRNSIYCLENLVEIFFQDEQERSSSCIWNLV
jgi:hypothetical protein